MDSHCFCRHLHLLPLHSSFKRLMPVSFSAVLLLLSFSAFGAGPEAPPPAKDDTAYPYAQIRLFNFRHASQLATLLGGQFPLLTLSSAAQPSSTSAVSSDVADDLLIAIPKAEKSTDPAVPSSLEELKRVVALLDLPRPQVTIQAWSIKVSSKDPNKIDESVKRLQQQINERNLHIQRALKFGWFNLMAAAQGKDFLDEDYRRYISDAFVIDDADKPKSYSLGYIHAFSPDQPSIATMLLCLAASKEPGKWIDQVIQDMQKPIGDEEPPKFPNFEAYLHALAGGGSSKKESGSWSASNGRQTALRAALSDFLFQYKWATLYPHDFVGYDLQNSATVLDSLFAPVVDALNRDIADYVKGITDDEQQLLTERGAKTQLASRGLITVASISGQQATVEGKTVSYFDITKPPTLSEMVKGMSDAKTNLTALFPQVTGNPALVAAALAAISAQDKTFVEIDKGMNLVITPTTLATAASAELDINLAGDGDKGQPADAPTFKGPNTSPVYTVDSIALHSVKTRVRVDSLKLFEVSTFSFDLMHPQPDGVVPVIGTVWQGVFGAVPVMGRLFTWHKPPDVSAHRSMIVVSALIVPTAMDLALGIRVESDRKLEASQTPGGDLQTHAMRSISEDPLLRKARPFHKKKLQCMLAPESWVSFAKPTCSCGNLSFDCVKEDLREAKAGTSHDSAPH